MSKRHEQFYIKLMKWYEVNKRSALPWRSDIDFYRTHVSEIMLQQTQVARVVDFFTKWIHIFPDYAALAQADIATIYTYWKGLGYNSRAKRLHSSAQELQHVKNFETIFELQKISGIGPYTQAALETFVFNKKVVLIETNVRRVFIHEFFKDVYNVHDNDIKKELEKVLEYVDSPREFYYALMDYGSTLPKIIKRNPNVQSKHYTKQSKFEGSLRQLRAKILFYISQNNIMNLTLQNIFDEFSNQDKDYIEEAVLALEKDKLIEIKNYIKLL